MTHNYYIDTFPLLELPCHWHKLVYALLTIRNVKVYLGRNVWHSQDEVMPIETLTLYPFWLEGAWCLGNPLVIISKLNLLHAQGRESVMEKLQKLFQPIPNWPLW